MSLSKLVPTLIALYLLVSGSTAMATRYSVTDIYNDGTPANVLVGESQLFVDVTDSGNNQVLFTFLNIGPSPSIITNIYFEEGATPPLMNIDTIINTPGTVRFTEITTSSIGGPPGGANIGWNNNATEFRVDPANPAPTWGINPFESLGILFDLSSTYTFANVISDLNSKDWRIAFHVQGFLDDGSDSFVINGPVNTPVPEPSVMLLMGTGIAALAGSRLRRRK